MTGSPPFKGLEREASEPTPSLDALCGWLRHSLEARLRRLRETAPRPELEVLLSPPVVVRGGAPPIPPTLVELAARLRLKQDETRILAVLLATSLEPGLGRALGLLADPLGRGATTWEAIAHVLGLPTSARPTAEGGLLRWALVQVTASSWTLDPVVEARLGGRKTRDAALLPYLGAIPYREPLPKWPVEAVAEQVRRAVSSGARSVEVWLRGAEGSGRRTFFAALARRLDLVAVQVEEAAPGRALVRQCWLDDLAPLGSSAPGSADLPPPVLQGRLTRPGTPALGVVQLTVTIPALDRATRREVWTRIVPAFSSWHEEQREKLVDAWSARPGQLVALSMKGVAGPEDANAALNAAAVQQLEDHCEVLDTPFDWDDLVLPTALSNSLRELAFEARALPTLWEEANVGRLFPQGRSVSALFSGPPGTGKTMAAQVLARELGRPLFRVDLSRIVSKYIGETSQNLARLLDAARDIDAVVFFDEADALFGRRTEVQDAHDRYANTETDYLLQALDSWPGVSLLASNKRGNIDPAFVRRMRVILEFTRPDAAERLRIWTRLAACITVERTPSVEPLLASVADGLELTGAQIKGALLSARLVAKRAGEVVAPAHILRGIERELEKDGRGLSPRDRKRFLD